METSITAGKQGQLSAEQAELLLQAQDQALDALLQAAAEVREQCKPKIISYSKKVFIPLTNYCRDDCLYCTFKRDPGQAGAGYLTPEQVLTIAKQGEAMGCKEALFSLGDKPELRFVEAKNDLNALGYENTIDYLVAMCQLVLDETTLLPHPNPGTISRKQMAALRKVSPSMGLMMENTSPRMRAPGMPHHAAPDKAPGARIAVHRFAGELQVPFTTGLLIGIGETLKERVDTLFVIKQLHERYGNIQEVIIQNFRTKPTIPMANHPDAPWLDLLRTAAVARLIFGGEMNIQCPPNLSSQSYPMLLKAGINDWGGISPVTPDHINPEAPWPNLDELRTQTEAMGYQLRERLTIYPEFTHDSRYTDPSIHARIAQRIDAQGFPIDQ